MNKYNTQWFKESLHKKYPEVEVLGKYINDSTKIKVKCSICGKEWEDTPTHLKQGRTCSNCKKVKRQEQFGKDFIVKAQKVHGNFYDYSLVRYITAQQKVDILCKEHGIFSQTPNSHLKGSGCPFCAGNNFLKTTEQFIQDAQKAHNNEFDYSKVDYKGAFIPVTIICNKCGNEFQQSPNHHLHGQGCPNCKLKSQNKLYEKLLKSFPNIEIIFETKPNSIKWLGLQRFDIYFPKYNIAVEYNGIQHYIPIEHFGGEINFNKTQEMDKLKRKKCSENGCTLFEIPYTYTDRYYNKLVHDIQTIIDMKDFN